ncbi:MAG: 1-acyl-sn-glycerol-3-phosphate acyltransferase [Phycisphaerales bacterium]|nr:1-acyl-sn-glycerol-3-phosphate acyltransferase [Phycisphaerales bacterium]
MTNFAIAIMMLFLLSVWIRAWHRIATYLRDNPRGTLGYGLVYWSGRAYIRIMHRPTIRGAEHIPDLQPGRGLIVLPNHTAGIDPILLQRVLPFEVRWMMGSDMAVPVLGRVWDYIRVIRVNRFGRDTTSARQALRHLAGGGVLGLFAEGFIERPPRAIRPFRPGVGLLIAKSRCPVLPIIIEETPQVDPAWASLFRPSRPIVTILPVIEASELLQGRPKADEIARRLQEHFVQATGWPMSTERRRTARTSGHTLVQSIIGVPVH